MEQNLQYTHIRVDNGLIKASFLHFGLNKEKKQMQRNSRNCKPNFVCVGENWGLDIKI